MRKTLEPPSQLRAPSRRAVDWLRNTGCVGTELATSDVPPLTQSRYNLGTLVLSVPKGLREHLSLGPPSSLSSRSS